MKLIFYVTIIWASSLHLSLAQDLKFSPNQKYLEDILRDTESFRQPTYCKDKWPAPSHTDPEIAMDPVQIAGYYGYPSETHKVHTKDRYILTLFRIPGGKVQVAGPRPAVFLQHGLLDSASTWVDNPANQSLAFILADAGFDVWLGNIRGNTYSRAHEVLSPDKLEFWRFTFDEMIEFDLPAMLEYVLATTGQPSLFYVGHSQGTLIAFARFATDKALASKVKHFFALGPVTTVKHMTSPIRYLCPIASTLADAIQLFGHGEFMPNDFIIRFMARFLCGAKLTGPLCGDIVFLLAGFDCIHTNETRLPVYIAHTPAGTSAMNVVHFAQLFTSGKCQKYDFGKDGNMKHYNQTTPPEYPVSQMEVPVSLFYGGQDWLADPTDVKNLLAILKNKKDVVYLPEYNHLDFVWGYDANFFVYKKIIQTMKASL